MWDRIEGDWNVFRHRVRHEWARLTDEHLDQIDGRRDRLARRVRDVYGVSDDEAEKQVAAWEASMRGTAPARGTPEPGPRLDSDPSAYPPSARSTPFYSGTNAAVETRNESRDGGRSGSPDPEPAGIPRTGTPRTGVEGVFDNEGQEFGEHDRPGGAGMPGNQGGGRDPGPVGPSVADPQKPTSRGSGASSGARAPGNASGGGSPSPPGTAGGGSG
jgi:uncharacterized protein YjbJ (UPF0337 family)